MCEYLKKHVVEKVCNYVDGDKEYILLTYDNLNKLHPVKRLKKTNYDKFLKELAHWICHEMLVYDISKEEYLRDMYSEYGYDFDGYGYDNEWLRHFKFYFCGYFAENIDFIKVCSQEMINFIRDFKLGNLETVESIQQKLPLLEQNLYNYVKTIDRKSFVIKNKDSSEFLFFTHDINIIRTLSKANYFGKHWKTLFDDDENYPKISKEFVDLKIMSESNLSPTTK